ncbi:sacsin N-terminal ATP-binding-like domain-containing protein [uncultured Enterovirga sp.]|uniref:sacsin N-terminal ATP-binding-like domain-containing protein n=1 Tax=uncultured Enterovirga sp. TaxID=2026352 RepID=UPI0035CA2DC7
MLRKINEAERGSTVDVTSPAAAVAMLAAGKLKAFAGTIDPTTGEYLDDVYAQNKSLAEHVAADYHGRFLIELVQNGNDAHPRERRDGAIEILLAETEGEHGTLYVANGGNSFRFEDVIALSRIGMSSKPPGEAIGNKGLGFRSVSHVCDAPEIYSQAAPATYGSSFQGFCFTFATRAEMAGLIADARTLELASNDLPIFFLPRWLNKQNPTIRSFAERHFASAVRLPLRDKASLQAVHEEIAALADDSAPLLLFLDRIATLNASVVGPDGEIRPVARLSREEKRVSGARVHAAVCELASSRWLILRDQIDEPAMQGAIAEGVEEKQLHGSWSGWRGNGEVALALRLDSDVASPRLYTHLPMGEGAAAPFSGHLHGTFFPTSNRKALDASVALNRLLLSRSAEVAARAVRWLTDDEAWKSDAPLSRAERARASADLLSWRTPQSLVATRSDDAGALDLGRLTVAALERAAGTAFAAIAVIPCSAITGKEEGVAWRMAARARAACEETSTFDLKAIATHERAAGAAIIWPGLGAERARSLAAFLKLHASTSFRDRLTAVERADIAAAVAGTIRAGTRPDIARWTSFYRDLASFLADAPQALRTKRIILCDDGSVRGGLADNAAKEVVGGRRRRRSRGEGVEPSLFFPPALRVLGEGETEHLEQLVVPRQLAGYFAFAASALPWNGPLRTAREFLEKVSVAAYDGEAVLTRISQVVNAGATVEQAVAGLRWAFTIWRRATDAGRSIKVDQTYRLLVPNAEQSLVPATEAIFSESWPDYLLGKRLNAFLNAAPPDLPDLAELRRRRLAPIDHRAFARARIPQWAEFLVALGVRRGLQPMALPAMPRARAWEVTSLGFASALGVSEAAVEEWRRDLKENLSDSLRLTYTTFYKFRGPLWWLPGQGDHELFSDDCRELYAALVVEWLTTVPEEMLRITLTHEYFNETHIWSTPAGAFVRSAEWLPADDPTPAGPVRRHYRPAHVWVSSGSDRYPPYLRQMAMQPHRTIERRQPEALRQLTDWGKLRVLGSRDTLVEQLGFLTEQFAAGVVGRYYEPQLANLYGATWRAVADRHAAEPAWPGAAPPGLRVLARRNGELTAVTPGANGTAPAFVRDTDDELAPSLVSKLDAVLIDIKGADRTRLGRAMDALFGKSVRRLSQLRYRVRLDDQPLDELDRVETIVAACPWLRAMLATAMEGLRGTDAWQLPADRTGVLDRLARVSFHVGQTVVFEIDGVSVAAPADRSAYLFRTTGGGPLVVLLHSGAIDWSSLDECLPAICEAIELPSVVTLMRLLAWTLRDAGEEVGEAVVDGESIGMLCRALRLERTAEAAVGSLVGAQVDARLPWVRAVLHYAGGAAAVASLHECELGRGEDVTGLVSDIARLVMGLGFSPDDVFAAARRALSTAQFRELLELEFGAFNESLAATGSEAVVHPELHASQLANYVVEHEVAVIEALRNIVVDCLARFEPEPRYQQWRDSLRALPPDPAWLFIYHFIPEPILAAHLQGWLASLGAPSLGANPRGLEPLADVRAKNGTALGRFAAAAAPLVRAWWMGPAETLPEHWRDARAAEQKLRAALDAAGTFDAAPLDEAALILWAKVLKLWPANMPASLDLAVLELDAQAINAAEAAAKREAEERAAAARSVRLNGRDIDPAKADWSAISAEIAANLSRQAKGARLTAPAGLAPPAKRPPRKAGERLQRDPGSGLDRTPPLKKEMIGRLGELVVYHWLKERYPAQDIDKAWVSGNATHQHAKPGSDGYGYDFKLELDRRTWLIEVKASQGDSCRFEMGETEVREARKAARPRSRDKYVVVYVADPGNSAATRIDVLPNPMSDEASGMLEMLGEGIRYGFRRSRPG